MLTFFSVQGPELGPWLDQLADLRIKVFREFPYLYDGTKAYEANYLQSYLNSPRSLVVLAKHGEDIVGASTCLPLSDEWETFQQPFIDRGIDPQRVCYFAESIILAEYRGQKSGQYFFKAREEHAKKHVIDLAYTTFCAVEREANHPLRPSNYRDLSEFWQRMGYQAGGFSASLPWKDIDKSEEDNKTLNFWLKRWAS